jgi:Ca2+-binding RTX toxin-like protein
MVYCHDLKMRETMLTTISNTVNKTSEFGSANQGNYNPSNIVFIDPRVDNFSSLVSGLKANVEAVILDSTKDGIEQITEFLKGRTGAIDSVQILSHGSAGNLQLGSTQLNSETLGTYQEALKNWFSTSSKILGKTPDLILYGCDVASGEVGESFIHKLSQITGADVAASVDLTGNAAKGGNWILEKATGAIEAGQAFTQKVRDAYQDILATFLVTNTNDSGAGSLRQAILDANANPGLDTINFNIGLGGPQTIRPTSDRLPDITGPVLINGESQPGFTDTNTPIIEIDGSNFLGSSFPGAAGYSTPPNPGWYYHGLRIVAGGAGSTIQGLVINNFPNSGIKLGIAEPTANQTVDGPANVTVQRNYIGTDITGTVSKGNGSWGDANAGSGLYGVRVNNAQFLNNVVSGNWITGVNIRMADFGDGGTRANTISGNRVGTDVTGNFALGNHRWGVYAIAGRNTITNNIVAANGIDNPGNSPDGSFNIDTRNNNNVVTGNRVGISASGVALRYRRATSATATAELQIQGTGNTNTGNILPTAAMPFFVTPTFIGTVNPKLSDIPQNAVNNNGNLVKDLAAATINSAPGKGIAITATNNDNGTWQYSTDNGNSWRSIQAAFIFPNNLTQGAGSVPALYLAADDKNRVRFVPNAGFTGTVTNGVTYRAWNQKFGGNGQLINVSFTRANIEIIRQNLSIDAFTAPITRDFGITVTPVNVAPDLVPNQVQATADFATAIKTTAGVVIGTVLATSTTDPDAGAQKGVAITKLDGTNGTWQYSINGQHWIPIDSTSLTEASALLLDSTSRLRFVANAGFTGTPETATFRAWDQTNGINGNTVNATANGGATSVSQLDVNILNFAPVLAPGSVPATRNQVDAIEGLLVSDFAASAITDANITNLKGIAITDAPSTDGTWQYSTNGGTSWINIGAVSPTNALLLDISNKIRFVPSVNETFNKNISFRAWDQTKGNPGERLDVGINGGSTSFSNQLATLTINIPIDPSKIPSAPNNGPLDPGILPLLRNPDAPATPDPVVVGQSPVDSSEPSTPIIVNPPDNQSPTESTPPQGTGTPNNNSTKTYQGTDEDDFLVGNAAQEAFYGKKGRDTLWGARGDDNLFGAQGNDFIRGGRGKDLLRGGRGNDLIYGGRGKDTIYGGEGEDIIYGNFGKDTIYGGAENDRLYGGYGKDVLYGEGGNDLIRGGRGRDILHGGDGNDLLIGGWGHDTLTGGAGSDRFRLEPGKGTDTITDFVVGVDFIELAKGLRFADLKIVQGVGTTVVGLQPGPAFPSDKPLALLTGVTASSLTSNSFLPV